MNEYIGSRTFWTRELLLSNLRKENLLWIATTGSRFTERSQANFDESNKKLQIHNKKYLLQLCNEN
ncbi:hypothetical protein LguiB_000111 [Lonicera macranthoides]